MTVIGFEEARAALAQRRAEAQAPPAPDPWFASLALCDCPDGGPLFETLAVADEPQDDAEYADHRRRLQELFAEAAGAVAREQGGEPVALVIVGRRANHLCTFNDDLKRTTPKQLTARIGQALTALLRARREVRRRG